MYYMAIVVVEVGIFYTFLFFSAVCRSTDVPNKENIISVYLKHLLLKSISTFVTVPFVCAGHMLRVQV